MGKLTIKFKHYFTKLRMENSNQVNVLTESIKAIISTLVEKAVTNVIKIWKRKVPSGTVQNDKLHFERHILKHFNEMYNWSNYIEFIGLGTPLETKTKTIKLGISYNVRKLTNKSPYDSAIDEKNLITQNSSFIILGDPGIGKSTTLKRLLNYFFFSNNDSEIAYNYPLLIKCRDIEEHQNIYTYICDLLGIKYETEEKTNVVKVEKYRYITVNRVITRMIKGKEETTVAEKFLTDENGKFQQEKYIEEEIKKTFHHYINGENIELIIPELLEENKVLLLIDGLDELNQTINSDIQTQINKLAQHLFNSKILITCRPDYLQQTFPQFTLCQICDLTIPQLDAIAHLWLEETTSFFNALEDKSYFELAKRPLFLCFLLLLFKEDGFLPPTSKEVYRQIIELLISKWDKSRGIYRASKYQKFDVYKKVEFLSHLSFTLTYILKTKSFSNEDLILAYSKINQRFGLPPDEALAVCNEIENHIGIIVKAFYDRYEFSHLALQEFLAASYIVNGLYTSKVLEYLKESPAPVAMAIALSSESTLWLSKIIYDFFIPSEKNLDSVDPVFATRTSKLIIRKLLIETPFFEKEDYLGLAILLLCKVCNCNDVEFVELIDKFMLMNTNVLLSVNSMLEKYSYVGANSVEQKYYFTREQYFKFEYVENSNFLLQLTLPLNLVSFTLDTKPICALKISGNT